MLQFAKGDDAVQGVMQCHSVRKRAGEISAHFPIDPDHIARCRPVDEAVESGCSELKRLSNVRRIASHKGCSAKSVHPFC
jgi:hypothetical protein